MQIKAIVSMPEFVFESFSVQFFQSCVRVNCRSRLELPLPDRWALEFINVTNRRLMPRQARPGRSKWECQRPKAAFHPWIRNQNALSVYGEIVWHYHQSIMRLIRITGVDSKSHEISLKVSRRDFPGWSIPWRATPLKHKDSSMKLLLTYFLISQGEKYL